MAHIRLVDKDLDLTTLERVDWDVVCHGIEYQVYRVPGYVHSIGGRWGENDYWAAPRNESPTRKNLVEYCGCGPTYGIKLAEMNDFRSAWGEREIVSSCSCIITRNGKPFYGIGCNDLAYGYAEAYRLIRSNIQEGPVNFNKYHYWETEIEGRQITYDGEPGTLYHYMQGQCCAMVAPGYLDTEELQAYRMSMYSSDDIKADLLQGNHIDWFPSDAPEND